MLFSMVLEHGCHLEFSFDAKIQIGSRNEKMLVFNFGTIFFLQVDPVSKMELKLQRGIFQVAFVMYLSGICHALIY